MKDLPEGSRLGWVAAKDGRANQAAPDLAKLGDREWNTLEVMEKIAKEHGKT